MGSHAFLLLKASDIDYRMNSAEYFQLIVFVAFLALQAQGKWLLVEAIESLQSKPAKTWRLKKQLDGPFKSRHVSQRNDSDYSATNDYNDFEYHYDTSPDVSFESERFQCKCGQWNRQKFAGNRIIGGSVTYENKYPWMVRIDGGCTGKCTGTLISDRHILTAFHCMAGSGRKPCDHSKGDRIAYIGGHYVSSFADPRSGKRVHDAEYSMPLTKMTYPKHQRFNLKNKQSHDLAIYTLEKPVKFSKHVSPICLPKIGDRPKQGDLAVAAGWGDYLIGKNPNSHVLREVTIKLGKNLAAIPKAFTTKVEINANGEPMDPCNGDSGGPLMWKNNEGRMAVIGTVHGVDIIATKTFSRRPMELAIKFGTTSPHIFIGLREH